MPGPLQLLNPKHGFTEWLSQNTVQWFKILIFSGLFATNGEIMECQGGKWCRNGAAVSGPRRPLVRG